MTAAARDGAAGRLVTAACPKSMRWGPCGGVRPDGACELGGFRCPFLDRPVLASEVIVSNRPPAPWSPPWLLVDVRDTSRARVGAERMWERAAGALRGGIALIGEHADEAQDDSGRLPIEAVVQILAAADVPVVVTITGRNRDRLRAAARIRHLRSAGVSAVHAVTGDHPRAADHPPVTWSMEGTSLTTLAASMRVPVTVAESPAVPGDRQARLEVKRASGAAAVVLNHAGHPDALVDFVDEHRRRCALDRHHPTPLPAVAPVPMVCDLDVARRLERLPGVALPPGLVPALHGGGRPRVVEWAAELAAQLMASGRFAGIDLSGDPGGRDPEERAERSGEFVRAVLRTFAGA